MKVWVAAFLLFVALAVAIYFLLFFKTKESRLTGSSMAERVELKTKDSILIVGDYYPPPAPPAGGAGGGSAKGLLLLHMMPATRTSWKSFAEKIQRAGWQVLSTDLRGHGESTGGPDGYRSFSDEEHQASRHDVEAGVEFLKSKGVSDLYLGGASIGANLALQYLADPGPVVKAAFLLSPGLDYRGVKTEDAARNLKPGQVVFYAASRDDAYSAETIQALFDATPAGVKKEMKFFENAGHGTTIFQKEPQYMDEIVLWLQKVLNN